MSSALYTLNYSGQTSGGGGVVYIGNGKIVGIDASNFRYHGSYVEQGGRLNGTLGLTAPTAGELVTDKQNIQLSAGTRIELALDWALDFSNGKPQLITIEGRPVHVLLEKVGDV